MFSNLRWHNIEEIEKEMQELNCFNSFWLFHINFVYGNITPFSNNVSPVKKISGEPTFPESKLNPFIKRGIFRTDIEVSQNKFKDYSDISNNERGFGSNRFLNENFILRLDGPIWAKSHQLVKFSTYVLKIFPNLQWIKLCIEDRPVLRKGFFNSYIVYVVISVKTDTIGRYVLKFFIKEREVSYKRLITATTGDKPIKVIQNFLGRGSLFWLKAVGYPVVKKIISFVTTVRADTKNSNHGGEVYVQVA